MKENIQFIIPVIISIVAILFSGYQLFLSNKQFLFDKRLKLCLMYKELLKHQYEVKVHFQSNPDELIVHNMLIAGLTNDSYLSSMCNGWLAESELLEEKDHKNFLTMIEKLRLCGEESSFVFNKYGKKLHDYFNKYADLCLKTYQYRIERKHTEIENKRLHEIGEALSLDNIKESQRQSHEEMKQIYTDLCKISKTIQLSKLDKSISVIQLK